MKFPSGFVPVNFDLLGKVLFALGVSALLLKVVDAATGWLALPDLVLVLGIGFILVSLYLLLVVSESEKQR